MSKLVVASIKSERGELDFALSHHEDKEVALRSWEEDGFDIGSVQEIKLHISGDTAGAVLRALARTPDGADTLSRLLAGAASAYQDVKSGSS